MRNGGERVWGKGQVGEEVARGTRVTVFRRGGGCRGVEGLGWNEHCDLKRGEVEKGGGRFRRGT